MTAPDLAAAGRALEQAYDTIGRTRMQGLPIVNPELRVKLVGLREWQGDAVGVLVTPWCMNLLALPLTREWPATRVGATQVLDLPSGSYDLLAAHLPEVGPHGLGSLMSPMQDFSAQQQAVDAARAAMDLLFAEPGPDVAAQPPREPAPAPSPAARPGDAGRRNFLFGRAPR